MALSNGDNAVLDDRMSYIEYNNLKNAWYGATAPSNPQNGMIWVKNDGIAYIYFDSAWRYLWIGSAGSVQQNLITNSGFGVWSRSDDNKGLCTLNYDTGDDGTGDTPDAGDTVTGAASAATGIIISYTTATGTWVGGDAAGVLTLGACTGSWVDNEVLNFTDGETAAVNGETGPICNDPCQNDGTGDWTDPDSILTFNTSYYEVATDAANEKAYITSLSFTAGKIYKVEAELKDGTATPTDVELVSLAGAAVEKAWSINTTGSFVKYSLTFEATSSTNGVGIRTPTSLATNNIQMRYFVCYEITPCQVTEGGGKAPPDGWGGVVSQDLYRVQDDSTHIKGLYGLKVVNVAGGSEYLNWPSTNRTGKDDHVKKFQGRTVTFGCWIYDAGSGDDNVRLVVVDSAGVTYSSYATSGSLVWLEATRAISSTSNSFIARIDFDGSSGDIAYISQPMLVYGPAIGEGNYVQPSGEIVWLDEYVPSLKLDGHLGLSSEGPSDLNIEADSDAMLPKSTRALYVMAIAKDSGGATAGSAVMLRADSVRGPGFYVSPEGLTNDTTARNQGWQACDADGDVEYQIYASAPTNLDINNFRYLAVRVSD